MLAIWDRDTLGWVLREPPRADLLQRAMGLGRLTAAVFLAPVDDLYRGLASGRWAQASELANCFWWVGISAGGSKWEPGDILFQLGIGSDRSEAALGPWNDLSVLAKPLIQNKDDSSAALVGMATSAQGVVLVTCDEQLRSRCANVGVDAEIPETFTASLNLGS
jgi:hypothetical protein